MEVYLLPGLGTDRRLFSRLDLGMHRVRYLEWPEYTADHSLAQIAELMRDQVDATRPHVLCGVSMGGMVAQELAVLTKPERVVLISSWIGPHEWPWSIRLGAWLQIHRVITERTMRGTWPIKQWLVGNGNAEIDRMLFDMACAQGADKVRNGLNAIFRWQGSPWKGPLVRIHGESDRVIPLRFPVDHRIPGGRHTMVIHSPKEVGEALAKILMDPPSSVG